MVNVKENRHNRSLVNCSYVVSAARSGILESISGNSLGSLVGDQLDRLDDTWNNLLMIEK